MLRNISVNPGIPIVNKFTKLQTRDNAFKNKGENIVKLIGVKNIQGRRLITILLSLLLL